MKVLVVSAHYPPNFVSGGTLAPQRQAHGLRAMGHEVSVYAGWLGDRPALQTWSERDPTGMSVRWVVTSPWIEYGDRNNYDNPAVLADFTRHLAEVGPDLVHFHSLQTLGAGLLEAAAHAGCKVVVTMHDFWWCCARQFLVTREFEPCCLVVSCGLCPCEVDSGWLAERNAHLAAQLTRADVVLAVSRSAAQVLAANGVDPARLGVDENAVPASVSATGGDAVRRSRDGHLRLTYTGGALRLKGVHVLFDAARLLATRPGWQLTAYGARPFVEKAGLDVAGVPVELRPPFEPKDAESVFSETDVLVVPSVMRETYSLVTREALTRGVPVVCTDCLGPEEVVVHGHNGLVVPAADPGALAAAIGRLLEEPELLESLRAGCRGVRVRSMDDQVTGLDHLYRELLSPAPAVATGSGPAPPSAPDRPMGRVLFVVGIQGAPLRYRARLPAEALALMGVRSDVVHYRDPASVALAAEADALVVYRVPATTQVLDLIGVARRRGVPVFFDVDDLVFDPELAAEIPAMSILPSQEAELWLEGVRRYRTTMEACDVYIGSTEALCRHAESVVGIPAERFANGVGVRLARLSDAALSRAPAPGRLRVGYMSGTDTHDEDWRHVEPAVVRLLESRPETELWLVGLVRRSAALDRFGSRVRRLPLQPWTDLPSLLREVDVNLAPLQPERLFNDAKSAVKWLEAALCRTPTVASPSQPFQEVIRDGANGLLAASEQDWMSALLRLVDDGGLRERLGRRAQRDALLRFSPHLQGSRYLEILQGGAGQTEHRPPSDFRPVVHDEPFSPVRLEPYDDSSPPPDQMAPATWPPWRRLAMQAGALAGKGWHSLVEQGPTVTARRAVTFSRREWRVLDDRRRWRKAARGQRTTRPGEEDLGPRRRRARFR